MARVVLEVTETRPILDDAHLMDHITAWRDQGYRIALDDYGVGYMGVGALLTVRPHIVKIDRAVTAGAWRDSVRQAAVMAILHVAHAAGAIVIAEGVETAAEYWLLRQLGVRYMQGYFFAKPQFAPHVGPMALPPRLPTEPNVVPSRLEVSGAQG